MNYVILYGLFTIGSYLIGSIPTGLTIAKWAKGVDIRQFGSGNTGMANVTRTVGLLPGILVLALDTGKGLLPILLIRIFEYKLQPNFGFENSLEVACGLASLIGHNWSAFINFKGGKGVATGMGTLIALSPASFLVAATVGLPVMLIWRYMSLSSLAGAISGGLTLASLSILGIHPTPWCLFGIIGATLITFRHKENIRRLRNGTETKLGQPGTQRSS